LPRPESHFESSITYSDLMLPATLQKTGIRSFGDLINLIPEKQRGSLRPSAPVHLDPDIRSGLRAQESVQEWKAQLGQCCSPDAALASIEKGDLFIFFGWYVLAEWKDQIKITRNKSFHSIWGWLEVGEQPIRVANLTEMDRRKEVHPHFANLRDGQRHNGNRNSVYVAADKLSFRSDKFGAGVLDYKDSLRLTHPACRNGCRSLWRLPRFFHQRIRPLPSDAWHAEGSFTCVQAAGQNQEYIFERPADGSLDEDIENWLGSLF